MKLLNSELKIAEGCDRKVNSIMNKKSALKARKKKHLEKDFIHTYKRMLIERHQLIQSMCPDGIKFIESESEEWM